MATRSPEVDLAGIRDPQRPVAFVVGLVLIVVGVAGLTGVLDLTLAAGMSPGSELVVGLFGIPVWLGVTAIVAGLLGILLSLYAGAGTTFTKVAAGLVLPPVLLLALTDWGIATGGLPALVLGAVTLLLAVVFVAVGTVLLYGHALVVVLPVVALLAIADWAIGLTAMTAASEPANLPTVALLLVLAVLLALIGFEGGSRMT